MLPSGHLAVSYLLGKLPRLRLPAAIVGGMLPDIDFVLLPLPVFNQIHRVVTHNLLFVLSAALLISLWAKPQQRLTVILSVLVGGLIHLFLDACLDANPSNGVGVALLWPLSDQAFSPFNLLSPPPIAVDWHQPLAMMSLALSGLIWEIPFYLLALSLFWRSYRNRSTL
ncbi:MAG: metal-dependent hydrolase [Cyanobacteria bacterium J06628_6]